uniref:Uncharacterized protein n=1 Tax=Triticum urartu TaxID=4572 RepID=A0A8R7PXA6_TRIUA
MLDHQRIISCTVEDVISHGVQEISDSHVSIQLNWATNI